MAAHLYLHLCGVLERPPMDLMGASRPLGIGPSSHWISICLASITAGHKGPPKPTRRLENTVTIGSIKYCGIFASGHLCSVRSFSNPCYSSLGVSQSWASTGLGTCPARTSRPCHAGPDSALTPWSVRTCVALLSFRSTQLLSSPPVSSLLLRSASTAKALQ